MKRNVFNSAVMGLVFIGLTEVGATSLEDEKQIAAVKQSYYAIKDINNPDKKVQLAAVKQNYHAIQYIKNPDKEVQMLAVEQDARAIKFIENPDEELQLAAVKQSYHAIKYIENPSIKATKVAHAEMMKEYQAVNDF